MICDCERCVISTAQRLTESRNSHSPFDSGIERPIVEKDVAPRRRGVTIDSDWVTTVGMALGFALTAFLLSRSIRYLLFFSANYGASWGVRRGWPHTLNYVIGAVYFFLFAYSFPAKYLKIAFLLLGTNYTLRFAFTYLSVAAGVRHSVALAAAIAAQIAYAIILFAIARWFKSVFRAAHPSDPGVSEP